MPQDCLTTKPLSTADMALLYHNQLNHFQWLKKEHGIDFGFSPRDVFTLIENAFTNSVQADVFSHSVSTGETDKLAIRYIQLDDESLARIAARKDRSTTSNDLSDSPEIQLVMKTYCPTLDRIPSGINVHVLDTLKSVEAASTLATVLGQEVKKVLDLRAVKLAFESATEIPEVFFDAEPPSNEIVDKEALQKILGTLTLATQEALEEFLSPANSYVHNAQQVNQIFSHIDTAMFGTYFRGGVSRVIAGSTAANYLKLNAAFSRKGAQPPIGVYQIGELYNIPVYVAPSYALKEHQLLCIWKNVDNPVDISISFTNCIPLFYSVDRKEFDIFGDYKVLNPQYIARASIVNMRGM